MTQKEISARYYKKRKQSGLCPRCGNPLDREGYYCSECLEKNRIYRRENREFYREHHLCVDCGKVKVPESEKTCPECRAKRSKWRKPLSEKIKSDFKHYQKSLYYQRKEQGICTKCGKRKSMPNKVKCGICLAKDAENHRKKKLNKQNTKEYRKENHLCYHCGNEIDVTDGQLCSSCLEKCRLNGIKGGGGNEYWEQDNKLIFTNGG